MTETRTRSLGKAISYRLVSSLVTGVIFFAATQKGRLALGVALVDSLAKVFVFYFHERAWTKIAFPEGHRSREKREAEITLDAAPPIAYESPSP